MQAQTAELNLRSNCPLKMSFQGHEKKSSIKTIDKLTADQKTTSVANLPQFSPRLTTPCLV